MMAKATGSETEITEPVDTSKMNAQERISFIKSLIRAGKSESEIAGLVRKSDGTPISESYAYKIKRDMVAAGELVKEAKAPPIEKPILKVEEEKEKVIIPPVKPPEAPKEVPTKPPVIPEIPVTWSPEIVKAMLALPYSGFMSLIGLSKLTDEEKEAIAITGSKLLDRYAEKFAQQEEILAFFLAMSAPLLSRSKELWPKLRALKKPKTPEQPPSETPVEREGKKETVKAKGKKSEELPRWKTQPEKSET